MMSRTKTHFPSNHSSTAYSSQSPSPPAPHYFPTCFSSPSLLFFSPRAKTKPVTHCVGCKWDVFWRDFRNVGQEAKCKTRILIYTTKKGEWERMNGSQRENKRKSTWVLVCIELLCLPVTSFFYITSLKIQHLNWINLPANHHIIRSKCCCQYWTGGQASFTLCLYWIFCVLLDQRSWWIN